MPDPISDLARGRYDYEQNECAAEPLQSREPEQKPGISAGICGEAPAPAPQKAAVEQLKAGVKSGAPKLPAAKRENCDVKVGTAVATCGAAGLAATFGVATGPGEIAALVLGGLACGFDAVEAYDCVKK